MKFLVLLFLVASASALFDNKAKMRTKGQSDDQGKFVLLMLFD